MKRAPKPPHAESLCSWCRRPLGDVVEVWNGGIGHPECVARVAEVIEGPGRVIPWAKPRRLYREDQTLASLRRLGHEAAQLGIDVRKLALAAERAAR